MLSPQSPRRGEDATDAATLRAAAARGPTADALPAAMLRRLIRGEPPVRVWRAHRGFAQRTLAASAGLSPGLVADLEADRRVGTIASLRKLARALSVDVDKLLPLEPK